jgi:hypothetical protein
MLFLDEILPAHAVAVFLDGGEENQTSKSPL